MSSHVPFSSDYTDLTQTQVVPASNRDAARELVRRMEGKLEREERQRLITSLIEDVSDSLRVFNNSVHGHSIPEDEIQERARATVTALLGNYKVERLP